MLSERQQLILNLVVDAYLESGKPVGSKGIAQRADVEWSASTVRSELAELEQAGYLAHPHTSAGRLPTDSGYRFYADSLLASGRQLQAPLGPGLDLTQMRREVDEAMRDTTSELSRITDLLAVATAPPAGTARIHRVEVLLLQPRVVMVVAIASNGGGHEARVHLRGARGPRARRVGVELPERAARGPRPRRANDRRPPRRPRAGRGRERRSSARSRTRSPGWRSAPRRTSTSRARRVCSPRTMPATCRTSTR